MNTNRSPRSIRGTIGIETLLILALVAVIGVKTPSGGPGKDHWWQFWKKNPVEQVAKTEAAVDAAKAAAEAAAKAAQARQDEQIQKQLKLGQDAAVGTGVAIAAAQATTAEGKLPIRELETAAQLNKTNTSAMEQAIGPADPARLRELELMVHNLNAGVAAGAKALELMQGALDRTVADKAAAQVELARVKAAGEASVKAAEAERAAAVKREGQFALERDALARRYERLTYFAKVAAILVTLIVLYVLFLLLRTHKLGAFVKDSVGMTEMLKDEIQKRASAEDYAAIKQRMSTDWMTVHDGTAALVEKAKKELRI